MESISIFFHSSFPTVLTERKYDAHSNKQIEEKFSGGAVAFRMVIGATDYTIDILLPSPF